MRADSQYSRAQNAKVSLHGTLQSPACNDAFLGWPAPCNLFLDGSLQYANDLGFVK